VQPEPVQMHHARTMPSQQRVPPALILGFDDQKSLQTGRYIVDPALLFSKTPVVASTCVLCKQPLLVKSGQEVIRKITSRKSHQSLRGFAISSAVKCKQHLQPLCLSCVQRWVGLVHLSETTVTVTQKQATSETWFRRKLKGSPWKQVKELTGGYIEQLAAQDALSRQSLTDKLARSAAESALNKGNTAGANVKCKLHVSH
jgi:hypothetical protein